MRAKRGNILTPLLGDSCCAYYYCSLRLHRELRLTSSSLSPSRGRLCWCRIFCSFLHFLLHFALHSARVGLSASREEPRHLCRSLRLLLSWAHRRSTRPSAAKRKRIKNESSSVPIRNVSKQTKRKSRKRRSSWNTSLALGRHCNQSISKSISKRILRTCLDRRRAIVGR